MSAHPRPNIERVDDLDDPRLAPFREVRDPALMQERNAFVVESRFAVRTLLGQSHLRPRAVLATDAALEDLADLLPRLGAGVAVFVASRATMVELVGFPFHQGCMALGERVVPPIAEALLASRPFPVVALQSVTNPDNVGAIFRNALAFGAEAVMLDERSADPLYRKAVRTSMGATLRLPYSRDPQLDSALAALRSAGYTTVALTPDPRAVDLGAWVSGLGSQPVALLLGNEGHGLTETARNAADVQVRIPMAPETDSLNVNAAAAIALYELRRAR